MRGAVVAALVISAACGRGDDLGRYQEQALSVTALYAPQLDGLATRCTTQGVRAAALPGELAGRAELAQRVIATCEAIRERHHAILGLPAATATAIQGRRRAEVVATLTTATSDAATAIMRAGDELAVADRDLAALETQAKAQAAPAPTIDGAPPPASGTTPPAPAPTPGTAPPAPSPASLLVLPPTRP